MSAKTVKKPRSPRKAASRLPNVPTRHAAAECCQLVMMLYDMTSEWLEEGKPPREAFAWQPPAATDIAAQYSPLLWGEAEAYRRQPGGRHRRYHWVEEWSPMGIAALQPDGRLLVGVRGTTTSREWDTNLRLTMRKHELGGEAAGKVHRGFDHAASSLRDELRASLSALAATSKDPIREVTVTGHSLGAAVATLIFADLATTPLPTPLDEATLSGIVFASPRVGDAAFRTAFRRCKRPFWRVENRKDLVCNVPLSKSGYTHVGKGLGFTDDKGNPIANHATATYLHAVQKVLKLA